MALKFYKAIFKDASLIVIEKNKNKQENRKNARKLIFFCNTKKWCRDIKQLKIKITCIMNKMMLN